jgi:hypothetical protein
MSAEGPTRRLDELLVEFGKMTGTAGLATEDNGVCRLVVDGGTAVSLMADPETGHLMTWSELGSVRPGRGEAALRALLQANLFWHGTHGGTVGLTPAGAVAVRALRRPFEGLDAAGLGEIVELMAGTAQSLAGVVAGAGEPPPAPDPLPAYLTAIRG